MTTIEIGDKSRYIRFEIDNCGIWMFMKSNDKYSGHIGSLKLREIDVWKGDDGEIHVIAGKIFLSVPAKYYKRRN